MAGISRTVRDLDEAQLELVRLRYITRQAPTLEKAAADAMVSASSLRKHAASNGWSEIRSQHALDKAQRDHLGVGMTTAASHDIMMTGAETILKTALSLIDRAALSLDPDDIQAAHSTFENACTALQRAKSVAGPSASGFMVADQGGPIAHVADDDVEHIPSHALKTMQALTGEVLGVVMEEWSAGQQAKLDAKEAAAAEQAGVTIDVTPRPGTPPAQGPPA